MESRNIWSLLGRLAVALVATGLTVVWFYMVTMHWHRVALLQPMWAIYLEGALMAIASVVSWLGVADKRSWLAWAAVGVLIIVGSLANVIGYVYQPVGRPVELHLLSYAFGLAIALVMALKQRKRAIQAGKPDNAEGQ